MSSWDNAVPGRGGSPSVHVPLGPRNTGLLGKRVFVDATGLTSLRGDSPELLGGPCTHQPASPWETEGVATGPRAPGPQRLGEVGRTLPRSFRRPPASILTSCLEAERAQFWWFTLLRPPCGPQTEPTASQEHPLIRPSLGLRVPGPPPGHRQPAHWVHMRPWPASPSLPAPPALQRKHSAGPVPWPRHTTAGSVSRVQPEELVWGDAVYPWG